MRHRPSAWLPACVLGLGLVLAGSATVQVRTATDAQGQAIRVDGSVVIVEPDIELSQVTAGGLAEPRKAWSDDARRLYPAAVHAVLDARHTAARPDFHVPEGLDPASRLGQILRLNEAVALSIAQYSQPYSELATKKDPATGKPLLDWSLGPGVSELRAATGADFALFTYIRDSYTSEGRVALRVVGVMLLGGDIGGGKQVGVATLVDLRSGKIVWFNLLQRQSGDLRDEAGTKATVDQMLEGIPL